MPSNLTYQQDSEKVEFYSTRGHFGCFSNFSAHKVSNFQLPPELQKLMISPAHAASVSPDLGIFPTSEHLFQALKFYPHSMKDVDELRAVPTAGKVAAMGRQRSRPMRSDWDSVRDAVMYHVVVAKFMQNKSAQSVLLGTQQAELVEHTTNDAYWGDGGDGTGKNMLGKTLMRVRDEMLQLAAAKSETADSTALVPQAAAAAVAPALSQKTDSMLPIVNNAQSASVPEPVSSGPRIEFYSKLKCGIYECFSNFFALKVSNFQLPPELQKLMISPARAASVSPDLGTFPTSEHLFQALKFYPHSPKNVEELRRARTPGEAAAMGRRSSPIRPDWDSVRDAVMYHVVVAKFTQNSDARAVLLGTQQAELVEHTYNDAYWGDGGDGSGKNMLGKTLMRVRDEMVREIAGEAVPAASVPLPPASGSAQPPPSKKTKKRLQ